MCTCIHIITCCIFRETGGQLFKLVLRGKGLTVSCYKMHAYVPRRRTVETLCVELVGCGEKVTTLKAATTPHICIQLGSAAE